VAEGWQKGGRSVTIAGQSAQLPEGKKVRPEDCDIHSQVLQEVLTRLDRAFQRCCARVKVGETPGYPRFPGANRDKSFIDKQLGNGATWENGFLVLSKSGRVAVRWSRPLEGMPKTLTIRREAAGKRMAGMAGMSAARAPTCQHTHSPPLDRKPGEILGLRRSPRAPLARAASHLVGIVRRNAR
jgi:hypothetical protein